MKLVLLTLITWISLVLSGQEAGTHEHELDGKIAGLQQNQGKKWAMDPNMAKIITDMEQMLLSSNSKNLEDFKATGSKLKASIEKLVSSCNMHGDAHDNLHAFLTAYIPTVHEMADATVLKDADLAAKKLKTYFITYHEYFE